MRRGGMIGVAGKLAFAIACLGLAAGCSSLPGGGGPGSTLANLVLFNSTTPPPAATPPPGKAPINLECPQIEVQDGTSSVRVYAGADQSNANLRYQFSLGDTARDCQLADGRLNIKVGVAGRVLVGPAGAPSSFTVPVRIVIRRESDEQPAVSQLYASPRQFRRATRKRISPSSPIRSACLSCMRMPIATIRFSSASIRAPARRRAPAGEEGLLSKRRKRG